MAYTKVFAIRTRLDDRVKYAINGDKTELSEKINYAADLQKTNSVRFVSALNCKSAETAFAAMRRTKEKFCKTGGVLGYHFIQSFAPGEVTSEQAHEIGCEFARRLFGEDFEVVVGTHLDKAHPHNHIIVNSVSRIDGHKYHSSPESYYNDVRGTSDELCRENNLSVITPRGKGKHYAEWKVERDGKPTVRGVIRADIDAIIQQAYTYDSFLMLLRKNGYEVRRGPNRKYTTVKPPGAKRAIRLDSLGEGYTEADILRRLSRQRRGGMAPPIITHTVKRYRVKGKLSTVRKKKITGFYALFPAIPCFHIPIKNGDMDMNRMKNVGLILCGLVLGLALSSPAARAVESLKVTLSTNRILVDGKEVRLTAYNINGNNYVMLRDVGKTVGFEVYWDGDAKCVQIESDKPYTGEAPAKAEDTKPKEQPAQTDVAAAKQDIVDRTNALRRAKGVAALCVNDKLMQAAQVRADEMAAHTVYSHTRPSGGKFNTVTDCPYMAENIHRIADWVLSDQTLAERAVADWSTSAAHSKNMVNQKLSAIGVGLARGINDNGDPCWYCVQLFLYEGCIITWVDMPAMK